MITDERGLPLAVALTAANVSDMQSQEPMLDAVPPKNETQRVVTSSKGTHAP